VKRGLLFLIITLLFLSFPSLGEEVQVSFFPPKIYQGKTAAIYLTSPFPCQKAVVDFLGQTIRCYPVGEKFRALVGIPADQKPGKYPLKIIFTQEDGSSFLLEKEVVICPTRFSSTWFWLKPAKKKLYVKDLIQKEWSEIERVLVQESPEQKWQNSFASPVSGPISMAFGVIEHINGKKTGQHRGLDLAVPVGTMVKAPERGKVVFARMLKAFGGTLVLDHGQGVHSLYFHLSKILKKVGEEVSSGEILALSGNSGISTGPHLHFGISVHNVRVDPLEWTKYAF